MTERPEVTVLDDPGAQRFEAKVGEHVAGWISYSEADGTVDLQHTVVADEYDGQGVGSRLVQGALDQLRDAGKKVKPSCPFVKQYIDEHDQYADLVA
jgi:uncharacterized protein